MSTINTTNLKNPSSGSNNVVLNADGTSTLTPSNIIKSGTAVASTSGTSIDFTGIPSWVKRVTVMLAGVSTNGTSPPQIQIGSSSGVQTTGYLGTNGIIATGVVCVNFTTGFGIGVNTSNWGGVGVVHGNIFITNQSSSIWTASGSVGGSHGAAVFFTTGSINLPSTLDRIRITTVNGTDAFDAGTVNILMEG